MKTFDRYYILIVFVLQDIAFTITKDHFLKRNTPMLALSLVSLIMAEMKTVNLDTLLITDSLIVSNAVQISGEQLRRIAGSRTLDSFLADLAGVDLSRRTGSIKARGVMVRGFDENRYAVLLNGRLMSGAGSFGGDMIDWNAIPVEQIASIELIRGTKSAEYGNALGGVIKITTIDAKSVNQTRTSVQYGVTPQWDSKKILDQSVNASFGHTKSIGKFADYGLTLSHWKNEGFLRNNYGERSVLGANLTLHLPGSIDLTGSLLRSRTDQGQVIANQPGTAYFDPTKPISDGDRTAGPSLEWKGGVFTFGDRSTAISYRSQYDLALVKKFKTATITASGYFNDQARSEFFYALVDTTKLVMERFSKPEDFTRGFTVSTKQILGAHVLSYGVDGQSFRSYTYNILAVDTAYFRKIEDTPHFVELSRGIGAYVQDRVTIRDTLVEIQAGVRGDRFVGFGQASATNKTIDATYHKISPNLGATARLWSGGSISLDGALRHRLPNNSEYYWYYNGYEVAGRSELKPEQAYQIECAVEQKFRDNSISASVRGYYYSINDYVRSIMGARPTHAVYNVDNVTFAGIECEGSYRFPKWFTAQANYTFQQTSKKGDALDVVVIQPNHLAELPAHSVKTSFGFLNKRGISAELKLKSISEKEVVGGTLALPTKAPLKGVIPAKLETIDGYTLVDLSGSLPLVRNDVVNISLTAAVENLFDVRYEEKLGFPMAGTTLLAGINASF